MTFKAGVFVNRGGMTTAAGGSAVENSAPMLIHRGLGMRQIVNGRAPRSCTVTGFAFCAERARMKNGVGVTAHARIRRAGELAVDVALFAINPLVRARQREGAARVIEGGIVPVGGFMAGGAVCSKFSIMFVIPPMTGIAVQWCAFKNTVLMAIFTFHLRVFPLQLEGKQVVVHAGIVPIGGRVAGGAVCAKFAVMLVVPAMARVAIGGRALIDIVLVAIFAGGLSVFPFQFEGRKAVVKFGGRPALGRVTGRAVRAEAAGVRVVRQVAGCAILPRRLHVCHTARVGVTGIARNFHVFPCQRKRKIAVIEIVPECVNAIVARKAVSAPAQFMRGGERQIHLTMTVRADGWLEGG